MGKRHGGTRSRFVPQTSANRMTTWEQFAGKVKATLSVGDEQRRGGIRGQRIVVTGAAGQLGTYLRRALVDAGATAIGFGHRAGPGVDVPVDITELRALETAIESAHPDVVIHGAAMTDVDGCERNPELADSINHVGSRNVANAALRSGAHLIAVSTDFVFSGAAPPYAEDAATDPISMYGASKRAGEQAILDASETFMIARTAWVYGGNGKHFPRSILTLLADRPEIEVVDDERGNPTFAGDLAQALVQLVPLRDAGVVHLTNEGTASRFVLAREVATLAGLDPERVQPIAVEAFLQKYPLPARRPADSSLLNGRAAASGVSLRSWREALASYVPRLVTEMQSTPA